MSRSRRRRRARSASATSPRCRCATQGLPALAERIEDDENGLGARIETRLTPVHRHLYLLGAHVGAEAAKIESSGGKFALAPATPIRRHATLAGVAPALWQPLAADARGETPDQVLARYRAALNALAADLATSDADDSHTPSATPATPTMNPSPPFCRRLHGASFLAAGGASLLLFGAAGCATRPQRSRRSPTAALAPTGRLRASINLGNPVLARRDAATGAAAGVSVDLARALADELGVPLELVVVDGAAQSVEAVKSGQADIGFFAIDPLRGDGIRFTAPYVLIEGALPRPRRLAAARQRRGRPARHAHRRRAAAAPTTLPERARSSRPSSCARRPRRRSSTSSSRSAPTSPAGVKQQLEADAARVGGVRLLPGRFMVIEQAMGLPGRARRGRAGSARGIRRARQGERLRRRRAGAPRIQGALVAPAARR